MNTQNTKEIELDAQKCDECDGQGRYEVFKKVTHLRGSDMIPFLEECEYCEGIGFIKTDAKKHAKPAFTMENWINHGYTTD